jgi:hypothetical protein
VAAGAEARAATTNDWQHGPVGVLFQFRHDPADGEPTLEALAARYGLPESAFDQGYGVVLIDEDAGLWVALVDDAAASELQSRLSEDEIAAGAGVFSNPRIEPSGDESTGPDRPSDS